MSPLPPTVSSRRCRLADASSLRAATSLLKSKVIGSAFARDSKPQFPTNGSRRSLTSKHDSHIYTGPSQQLQPMRYESAIKTPAPILRATTAAMQVSSVLDYSQ